MNHPDEALIHDFLDDELPSGEGARIAAHLADCASCRSVAGWARSLREEAVRVLGSTPPENDAVGGAGSGAPDRWALIEARICAGYGAER